MGCLWNGREGLGKCVWWWYFELNEIYLWAAGKIFWKKPGFSLESGTERMGGQRGTCEKINLNWRLSGPWSCITFSKILESAWKVEIFIQPFSPSFLTITKFFTNSAPWPARIHRTLAGEFVPLPICQRTPRPHMYNFKLTAHPTNTNGRVCTQMCVSVWKMFFTWRSCRCRS